MTNIFRLRGSRTARRVWLSAWAATALAAVAVAAGIMAGQGNAAPALKAQKGSQRLENPRFKHPKLKHGVLTIEGTDASDKIALRLQAGDPGVLQVDAGDDGSADFSFERDRIAKIAVDGRAGDDLVRIDESNGVFTDSIPTTIAGRDGNDTLAGADLVTGNDLTGTDVSDVNVDLAGTLRGTSGDGQADSVIVNGTNGNDTINVSGDASGVAVTGLAARVAIQHQEPNDGLTVNGRDGNDAISAATLAAQAITLTLDGGAGDDTIAGARGAEVAFGGDGNDSIDGNGGNDAAFLGAGDDTFAWDPGDGSDTIEGEDGADTML